MRAHPRAPFVAGACYFQGMKSPIRIVALPTCWLLVLSVTVGCHSDRVEWSYESLADLKKAEPSAQSWVPEDLLPESSHNILVAGELSPSKEWCAFEFTPSDSERVQKALKKVEYLPQSVRSVQNPHKVWWPNVLVGPLDAKEIRGTGLQIFIAEKPANAVNTTIFLFALDLAKGQGYFYSTYK
jgi:hypothetical protein